MRNLMFYKFSDKKISCDHCKRLFNGKKKLLAHFKKDEKGNIPCNSPKFITGMILQEMISLDIHKPEFSMETFRNLTQNENELLVNEDTAVKE